MIKNLNKTLTHTDIRTLIDRYMSGETSNEEEATLRSWFRLAGDDMPEEWRPLRALFSFVDEERHTMEQNSTQPTPRHMLILRTMRKPRTWISSAVAAAAVAIAMLVPSVNKGLESTPQNYAVIDGKMYTNPEVINEQVDDALQTVSTENEDPFSALDMLQ